MAVWQVTSAFAGATMTVNWVGSGEACDSQLTLEEAAHLGRGGFPRALTNDEKNQISGATFVPAPLPPECAGPGWVVSNGLGANFADNIVFVSGITVSINYGIVLGKNDNINGTTGSSKVILDGTSAGASNGIQFELDSGSQVRNLVIRNFLQSGILGQRMNGAIFEGLDIHGNGGDGISIGFSGGINSRNVRIGGDQPQHRNLIYGNGFDSNGGDGIYISAAANADRFPDLGINILNNYIGTSDGVTDNGNSGTGIRLVDAFGVIIGDMTGATQNIISGNNNDGITLQGAGAVSNKIVANYIGTNSSGGAALGNGASGVALLSGAGDSADFISSGANRIGMPSLGNVISANNFGVFIADANTSNNWVQANLIGTNTGGNTDLGNAADGVYFVAGTYDNIVGGTGTGEGNLIAFNRNGIRADSDVRNAFRRNRIFSNDLLGIDLAPTGVTTNDAGDADTGPNNLQNYPVITNVNAQSSSVTIQGTFNSAASQTYTLEFFGNTAVDSTGFGEGRNFLGTTNVSTDGSGNATFNVNFTVNIATTGTWITATATDSNNNTSEFSQARNICADLTLSPSSLFASNAGVTSSFTVINSAGCSYSAQSNAAWVTLGTTSMGTINFTVAPNPGVQRSSSINIFFNNGSFSTFTNFNISQSNGCTYSINPASQNISGAGGGSSFNVVASDSSCVWTAVSYNTSWITITGGSGSGSNPVSFNVAANTGAARSGTITAAGQTFTLNQTRKQTPFDFDGDGKTDLSIFRPSAGEWWYTKSSSGGNYAAQFGASTDKLTPGDFTGDGKTDIAFFRPSTGEWFILRSEDGSYYSFPFGANGDIPVPADFDNDGKADAAVFRPSTFVWYIRRSSDSGTTIQSFGQAGDVPAVADYDGDGHADIAIYRPSLGQWWLQRSNLGLIAFQFGNNSDKPVQGDYTGDGKSDVAIYRPSTGEWLILRSENQSYYSFPFGASGDVPSPGDYDGDGKFDATVFRPTGSTWFVQRSTAGTLIQSFGQSGDKPVPNAFVP